MASIEMKNIVKQYGDGFPAVNDVSLDIADGEFMILVGPSGCGKSTLLRMIVGLEDITSGDMIIGGKRVNDLAPRDRNLSMVFQNYALYPHMTVYENIAFPLRLSKTPDDEVRRRVTEASDVLELKEHLERKPANLSGGQRQRVAMGRAIVRQAEAFLFDEPLSNLDAKLRGQMRTEISRLQRRLGITTVYVTHDQTEAMTLGDRVCVLRKGKIQQVASPRELYEQPVNLFVAGFIGSPPMNFLPATPEGDRLKTPFGDIELGEKRMAAVTGRDLVLVGIRPEYFEDASLVDEAKRPARLDLPGPRRRHRVAGRLSSTPTSPTRRPEAVTAQLRELARELDAEELRTQAIVSIDSTSRIREGHEAEFWLDSRKVHVFDPGTGDNLTRDAEAGAELTRLATQDRVEQVEESKAERRRGDLGRRCLSRAVTGAAGAPVTGTGRAVVARRRRLRGLPAELRRLRRRRRRRPRRAAQPAALPGRPRRGRPVDHAVVPVADGRRRVRRRRLLRHRSAVRHAGRRRCPARRGARPRPAGDRRPRRQPHLRAASLVRRGARRRPGVARARRGTSSATAGPAARSRRTTGSAPSAARPGRACARPTGRPGSGTCTCSPLSSPTSTGTTRVSGTTSTPSCGSGSTAGSTGSASMPRPRWRR